MNHQQIGAYLLNKWNFQSLLSDAVLHHYNPVGAKEGKVITSLVHLADFMTQSLNVGNFVCDNLLKLDKSIIKTLNLGDEYFLEKFISSYADLFIHHSKIVRI